MLSALLLPCGPLSGGPLDTWHWRIPHPTGNDLTAVAFGQGRLVAVGAGGTILTSVDGNHWLESESPAFEDLAGVAFGGNRFVAVGHLGAVYTSGDGLVWTGRDIGTFLDLYGVVYGNAGFVAVGDGSSILTSPDGELWTLRCSGSLPLNDVTYADGQYVAVGGHAEDWVRRAVILTSADGIAWVARDPNTAVPLQGVTYGQGLFVAVGGSMGSANTPYLSAILTSPDGVAWTPRIVPGGGNLAPSDIAYSAGTFCAVGASYNAGWLSTNGIHWQSVRMTVTDYQDDRIPYEGIAYGNTGWVAVGSKGRIRLSRNGQDWYAATTSTNIRIQQIVFESGRFMANAADHVLTSTNAISWTPCVIPFAAGSFQLPPGCRYVPQVTMQKVATGNGLFVVLRSGRLNRDGDGMDCESFPFTDMLTSSNGVTWVPGYLELPQTNEPLRHLAFGNNVFLAVGEDGQVMVSANGTEWDRSTIPLTNSLPGSSFDDEPNVVFGNGHFVVWWRYSYYDGDGMRRRTAVFVSDDGIHWSTHDAEHDAEHDLESHKAVYGNGRFLAVNYDHVCTSADGITWTVVSSGLGNYWIHNLVFTHGMFAAIGDEESLLTTTNGVFWDAHFPLPTRTSAHYAWELGCVGSGNNTFVVGGYGFLLQSDPLTPTPPLMGNESQQARIVPGIPCSLRVEAGGSPPLSYRWYKDGLELAGAHRAVLELPQVQTSDAGEYWATVQNAQGLVSNRIATVTVQSPEACFVMRRNDAPSEPSIPGPTSPVLLLESPLGCTWRIDTADSLGNAPGWRPLRNIYFCTQSLVPVEGLPTNAPQSFFRAVLVP